MNLERIQPQARRAHRGIDECPAHAIQAGRVERQRYRVAVPERHRRRRVRQPAAIGDRYEPATLPRNAA
jgi:hypothetical protein